MTRKRSYSLSERVRSNFCQFTLTNIHCIILNCPEPRWNFLNKRDNVWFCFSKNSRTKGIFKDPFLSLCKILSDLSKNISRKTTQSPGNIYEEKKKKRCFQEKWCLKLSLFIKLFLSRFIKLICSFNKCCEPLLWVRQSLRIYSQRLQSR